MKSTPTFTRQGRQPRHSLTVHTMHKRGQSGGFEQKKSLTCGPSPDSDVQIDSILVEENGGDRTLQGSIVRGSRQQRPISDDVELLYATSTVFARLQANTEDWVVVSIGTILTGARRHVLAEILAPLGPLLPSCMHPRPKKMQS
jgi:hypothetical protein